MPRSSSTSKAAEQQARSHVRAYIAALPPVARRTMTNLRAAIRAAAPGAVEHYSYHMPGFRLEGKGFLGYAAWKHHASMYPFGPALVRAAGVTGYESEKGTIRFPYTKPPSSTVVKRLIKARLAQVRRKPAG